MRDGRTNFDSKTVVPRDGFGTAELRQKKQKRKMEIGEKRWLEAGGSRCGDERVKSAAMMACVGANVKATWIEEAR